MQSWQCCRTCLSDQCLNPIFSMPEHSDKYTNIIYMATGLKVEINDSLPQEMCPNCIIFINESIKFRNKCEQTRKLLEERLNNQSNIKTEPKPFKAESEVAELDISEQLVIKDEFEAYDDNITLNNFGVKNIEEIADNEQTKEQADITKLDKVEQSEEVPFDKSNKDRENYLVKDNLLMERPAKTKQRKRKFVKEDIECEICHKILTSKLSYWKHSKIHTGFEVVCEVCGKLFRHKYLLTRHKRAKHGLNRIFKCIQCEYTCATKESLLIHARRHSGERPYQCDHCGSNFHRRSNLVQHIAIHLPEEKFKCDICLKRVKSQKLLQIHLYKSHKENKYRYICPVCQDTFTRPGNVRQHLTRSHGVQRADQGVIARIEIQNPKVLAERASTLTKQTHRFRNKLQL